MHKIIHVHVHVALGKNNVMNNGEFTLAYMYYYPTSCFLTGEEHG